MGKFRALFLVSVFLFLQSGFGLAGGMKEKTIEVGDSTVDVKVIGEVDVVDVKPYIKARKGKKKGRLWLDVVIKNTGQKPLAVSVFGQGQGPNGGWHGGALERFPEDAQLEPGKQMTAKVRTGYSAEAVPKMLRVEIFPPM